MVEYNNQDLGFNKPSNGVPTPPSPRKGIVLILASLLCLSGLFFLSTKFSRPKTNSNPQIAIVPKSAIDSTSKSQGGRLDTTRLPLLEEPVNEELPGDNEFVLPPVPENITREYNPLLGGASVYKEKALKTVGAMSDRMAAVDAENKDVVSTTPAKKARGQIDTSLRYVGVDFRLKLAKSSGRLMYMVDNNGTISVEWDSRSCDRYKEEITDLTESIKSKYSGDVQSVKIVRMCNKKRKTQTISGARFN